MKKQMGKILDFVMGSKVLYLIRGIDENKQLSKNFKAGEFFCQCGKCDTQLIRLDHVKKLQLLRDRMGIPLKVNSGYRCVEHNAKVGGEPKSTHTMGMATDLSCDDLERLKFLAEELNFGGIGNYATFLHVDCRVKKARWHK